MRRQSKAPSSHDPLEEIQEVVALEQLRAHYAQIPVMALAPLLGGLFSSAVLWNAVESRYLVIGMTAVGMLSALRLMLWHHYFKLSPALAARRLWRVIAFIGAGVSGCIWGSAALFLYPPLEPNYLVFLVVLLTLLPVVPIAALAAYMPALYAYYLPCLFPFVAVLAMQPSRSENMAALLLLMMLGAMLAFARRYSASLAEAIRLRVQLDDRSRKLQQVVSDKSQFIVSASHDLRQPLEAMGLLLHSMREKGGTARDEPAFSQLENSLNSLRGLLTNMLDISRLDASIVGPQLRHFELDVLLHRLADEHLPLAQQKGLQWRRRLPPAIAYSDPVLLERILRNLLSNALRYTSRGGVLLACRRQAESLRVHVVDTGIGIAEVDQRLVFDAFKQLASAEGTDPSGFGLGLAIVQRLSRLLDHALVLRSVVGRGSTFTIVVPRGNADEVAELVTVCRPTTPKAELTPGWIVIVDNDAAVGAAASALLQRWGHCTSVCTSAADMTVLLEGASDRPQLLLVDFHLGNGRSGLDEISAVFERVGYKVPVILVTGDTTAGPIRQAYEAGHMLLHKPMNPPLLRQCIADLCSP